MNNKANFYFGVGSLLLLLIVLFVIIAITNPSLGNEITGWIGKLFTAVRG
jgi:hypothetical protein